jgi:hypothetical protein
LLLTLQCTSGSKLGVTEKLVTQVLKSAKLSCSLALEALEVACKK